MKFYFTCIAIFCLFISCRKDVDKILGPSIKLPTELQKLNLDSIIKTLDTTSTLTIAIPLENNLGSSCIRLTNNKNISECYPFNSIKLCNVKSEASGASQIIYSDEPNFDRNGSQGEVMAEIPKVYLKRFIDNNLEYISISEKKLNGYSLDPAFIENGVELDHIYIGVYSGVVSNNKLRSITNEMPTSNLSLDAFRKLAQNTGKGFGLMDARSLFLLQRLFMVYYSDRNSQLVLGKGISSLFWQTLSSTIAQESSLSSNKIYVNLNSHNDRQFRVNQFCAVADLGQYSLTEKRLILSVKSLNNNLTEIEFSGSPVNIQKGISRIYSQIQINGLTDDIFQANGNSTFFGGAPTDGTEAVKFMNIENLWGNVWTLLDGFFIKDLRPYIGENMSDYSSINQETKYQQVNYNVPLQNLNAQNKEEESYAYIAQLGLDTLFPAYSVPIKIGKNASPTSGYADPFYSRNTIGEKYYAAYGGGFDHSIRGGLFTLRVWWRSNQSNTNLHGARIQFKKLTQ